MLLYFLNLMNKKVKVLKMILKLIFVVFVLNVISCTTGRESFDEFEYQKVILKEKIKYLNDNSDFSSVRAKSHYIDGLVLQQQHKYLESIIDFNLALRSDSSAVILFSLSKSYLRVGRVELAEESLLVAIDMDSEFLEAYDLLAEILLKQSRYSEAAIIMERTLKVEESTQRYLQLAEIYEFVDKEKSIGIYEKLIGRVEDVRLYEKILSFYRMEKDFTKVIEVSNKILEVSPKDRKNILRLMQYYLRSFDYENAFRVLEHGDKNLLTENLVYSYNIFIESMLGDGDLDVMNVRKMEAKIDHRFHFESFLHYNMGLLQYRFKNSGAVDKHFGQSLKVLEEKSDIPIRICLFYYDLKEYNKVLGLYEMIDSSLLDGDLHYLKALSYLSLDSNELAIVELRKSLSFEPENMSYLTNMGNTYDRLNERDSSEYYYKLALRVEPRNAMINNNLAYSYSQRDRNLEKALEMSRLSLEKEPENTAYLDTYAWINYKLGNYDVALEYLKKAISMGEASAEIYEHLGDVYLKLEDVENAQKSWLHSIRIDPERVSVRKKIELNKRN